MIVAVSPLKRPLSGGKGIILDGRVDDVLVVVVWLAWVEQDRHGDRSRGSRSRRGH